MQQQLGDWTQAKAKVLASSTTTCASVWRRPIRPICPGHTGSVDLVPCSLGDVQIQLGDTQSALAFYQQSLDINERLAAVDPTNAIGGTRELSISYCGDVELG